MRVKAISKLTLIFSFLALILTGCIEHNDINEMNFVLGAAFDYNTKSQLYEVHVQVAKTEAFAKGDGGQAEDTFLIYDGKGKTVFEAVRDLAKNGRKFFWAHCDVYVIGSALANKGIYELIDFLFRDNETREEAYILITNEPVKDIVTLQDGYSKVPMQSLINILEQGLDAYGTSTRKRVSEVFDELLYENNSYLLPLVYVRSPQYTSKNATRKFHITGAAVFKGQKMVGTLGPIETKGYNFITNNIANTVESINYKGNNVVIENITAKSRIRVNAANDEPYFLIEVKTSGNFASAGNPINIENPKIVKEIEVLFGELRKKELVTSINRAQELRTDYLGLGRETEITDPKLWERIKDQWQEEIFPNVAIDVSVKPQILRTGLIITSKPGEKYVNKEQH